LFFVSQWQDSGQWTAAENTASSADPWAYWQTPRHARSWLGTVWKSGLKPAKYQHLRVIDEHLRSQLIASIAQRNLNITL
jgi:hypothetical protein